MRVPPYHIELVGLKNGQHDYTFVLDDAFLADRPEAPVQRGQLRADVQLERSENMLTLHVRIVGEVTLVCDRSLEDFTYPLDVRQSVLFKFGAVFEELDDNIFVIPRSLELLDMQPHLYDFVQLSVPIKKINPRYEADESYVQGETAEGLLVYRSQTLADDADAHPEKEVDPRWEKLQTLKKNK